MKDTKRHSKTFIYLSEVAAMTHDKIMIQKAEEGFRVKVEYVPCGDSFYRFNGYIGERMEPEAAFALIRGAIRNIRALKEAGQ
jgi:hypothetical protein